MKLNRKIVFVLIILVILQPLLADNCSQICNNHCKERYGDGYKNYGYLHNFETNLLQCMCSKIDVNNLIDQNKGIFKYDEDIHTDEINYCRDSHNICTEKQINISCLGWEFKKHKCYRICNRECLKSNSDSWGLPSEWALPNYFPELRCDCYRNNNKYIQTLYIEKFCFQDKKCHEKINAKNACPIPKRKRFLIK